MYVARFKGTEEVISVSGYEGVLVRRLNNIGISRDDVDIIKEDVDTSFMDRAQKCYLKNKEKHDARVKRWREAHPELVAKYREIHKEAAKQANKRWKENNKDKVREYNHKYYLLKTKKKRQQQKGKADGNN